MAEVPAALHVASTGSVLLTDHAPSEHMEFCFKWHLFVASLTFSLVLPEAEFPVSIPKGQHSSTEVQPCIPVTIATRILQGWHTFRSESSSTS